MVTDVKKLPIQFDRDRVVALARPGHRISFFGYGDELTGILGRKVDFCSRLDPRLRLDLGLNFFSRHGRRSACRKLQPHRLHLGDTGSSKPSAAGSLARASGNRDLDGSHELCRLRAVISRRGNRAKCLRRPFSSPRRR